MIRYAARRLAVTAPILLLISLATVMIVATAVFAMNLAADLLYAVLDPRIRHG